MNKDDKILVLGGNGMVGSALIREFQSLGYKNILSPERSELDLLIQSDTLDYFNQHKPQIVINAAAKVGGILANNTYRADFLYENLTTQNSVFNASFVSNVHKMLFLGSSCIYPKNCPQPIKEEYLLTGPLEPTNEPYAIAKIAGLKMAENYRRQYGRNYLAIMPTNLYGINDNFDKETSHVIPGLITRMKEAMDRGEKEFKIWGTGNPRREFLYVDDLAKASIFLLEMEIELPYFLNVGSGQDITIKELAEIIAKTLGYSGKLTFDTSKPDGMMRKLLDASKIKSFGWEAKIPLKEGIKKTVDFYLSL